MPASIEERLAYGLSGPGWGSADHGASVLLLPLDQPCNSLFDPVLPRRYLDDTNLSEDLPTLFTDIDLLEHC